MIKLEDDIIRLRANKASSKLSARTVLKRNDRLVIDLYNLNASKHPENHLGWWLFHFKRTLQGQVHFDFSSISAESVTFESDGRVRQADDCWFNPDFLFSPVQDLHIIIRDRENVARQSGIYQLINDSPEVLKSFYDNLHATEGYRTTGNTFLVTLHHHKLGLLKEIFETRIPKGASVLDVGCGNSLFTEIAPHWDLRLFCCDLGEPVIRERTELFPQYTWLVAEGGTLPFAENSFDALFAGEVIEHVPSVQHTLGEWNRVLKPGGNLILTTPNRNRFRNRINGSRRPLGDDHLNELTFEEIEEELDKAGFSVIHSEGFYLELFLNWLSRGAKIDYLQAGGNKPENTRWINLLNKAGHYFPRSAFGLIFVARKK